MAQNDNPCLRCGTCCSSAFLALDNIPMDDDKQEIARWLAYHGCEPMRYPGENGDVLAVKIPLSCKHLVRESDFVGTTMSIKDCDVKVDFTLVFSEHQFN